MLTIDVIMLLNNVYAACVVHFYLLFNAILFFFFVLFVWFMGAISGEA